MDFTDEFVDPSLAGNGRCVEDRVMRQLDATIEEQCLARRGADVARDRRMAAEQLHVDAMDDEQSADRSGSAARTAATAAALAAAYAAEIEARRLLLEIDVRVLAHTRMRDMMTHKIVRPLQPPFAPMRVLPSRVCGVSDHGCICA